MLSTIISRIRGATGAVPFVVSYDSHERVWNPPMPLLFQRHAGVENRSILFSGDQEDAHRGALPHRAHRRRQPAADIQPTHFRRLFITDAIMNGMLPHIAQLVVGHRDINTTMG
ncbi:hypothetical protein [Streptomyces sp. NPDC060027]|uniref:hypothetical protein n=1 Tax=Streptomyces sp. NPDC060027 TaxID=3347040 RepID=UPI0036A357C8